jgi:hypothetical protein
MSDAVLTIEQSMKVLAELLANPGFRQRYQEKPAAALLEIGIPATTIANLPAACLVAFSQPLDVARIAEAQKALTAKTFVTSASMAIPNLRMSNS